MTDMIKSLIRRDPRFDITSNSELTVTIQKNDGTSESLDAEILNISAGGAKFKVSESIRVNDIVSIRIEVSDPERVIARSGRVRWVTPFTGDDWWLGCSFDQPVESEVLHELAVSGVLERRRHRREPVDLQTEAKWELRSETVDIRILNYSPGGGFCMWSPTDANPGERILLRLKLSERREHLVCGSVRWQVESKDGYLIGCEFLHTRNSAVLTEVLSQKYKGRFMSPKWLKVQTEHALRRWPVPCGVAAIAATMLIGSYFAPARARSPHQTAIPSRARLEPVSIDSRVSPEFAVPEFVDPELAGPSAPDDWLWNRVPPRHVDHLLDLRVDPVPPALTDEDTAGLPLWENSVTDESLSKTRLEPLSGWGHEGDWSSRHD